MSLKQKTVSGLAWTFTQQFSTQLITFIVSVVLARILLPAEFGLIGMISIFIAIGSTLINGGLTTSLIRTDNPTQTDYSTVFFINLAGSIVVYLILFFTAPLISGFFDQPQLTAIIRVYTISFIINAFGGVQAARLTKHMEFRTQMMIQVPSVIGGAIIGIILAYMGFGVWSLVWMHLFQTLLSTVQLWIRSRWAPSLLFEKATFVKHFNFGYKMMLSGLLDTIYQNIYNIIIGRMYPAAQLGFYTRAFSVRQLPVQNISTALNKVTFPMFASIQNNDLKLKMAYKRLMQQVLFWIAPTLIFCGILAEPIFRLLFTEKWLPAVPYFQLLCVGGILYPLQSYNLNILKVKGRSDLFLKLEIVKKVMVTIGLVIAIPFGIYGLLYFQIINSVLSFFVNTWYSGDLISYPVLEQLGDIGPVLLLAVFAGIIIFLVDYYLLLPLNLFDMVRISISCMLYFLIYLGIAFFRQFTPFMDFKQLVLKKGV